MRRRGFLTGLAAVTTLGLVARVAHAADRVTVVAELDRQSVQVGEEVELTVSVERLGEGAGIPEPVLPDLVALGITVAGDPSTYRSFSTMILNGSVQRRATQRYSYTLIASKPGSFPLPVHVMNGAVKIKVPRTPVLEVTGTAPVAAPIAGGSGDPTEAQGDMFLWTRLDKPRAYVARVLNGETGCENKKYRAAIKTDFRRANDKESQVSLVVNDGVKQDFEIPAGTFSVRVYRYTGDAWDFAFTTEVTAPARDGAVFGYGCVNGAASPSLIVR